MQSWVFLNCVSNQRRIFFCNASKVTYAKGIHILQVLTKRTSNGPPNAHVTTRWTRNQRSVEQRSVRSVDCEWCTCLLMFSKGLPRIVPQEKGTLDCVNRCMTIYLLSPPFLEEEHDISSRLHFKSLQVKQCSVPEDRTRTWTRKAVLLYVSNMTYVDTSKENIPTFYYYLFFV